MEQLARPEGRRCRHGVPSQATAGQGHPPVWESTIVQQLIDHGLIDDFRLWIFPIVLGGGKRLFQPDNRLSKFQLADTTTFSTGVVVLAFRPA